MRGVCVDSGGGYFYWCERDGTHVIRRKAIQGGTVQYIYTALDTPHGLVLDLAARKMYWTDTGTNAAGGFNARGISRGDMDGATPAEIVVAGTAANQPWDLDLDRRNTTYAEWAARFFRYDATNDARTDDPDFDGLKNVAEYALGSAPARGERCAGGMAARDGRRRGLSGDPFPPPRGDERSHGPRAGLDRSRDVEGQHDRHFHDRNRRARAGRRDGNRDRAQQHAARPAATAFAGEGVRVLETVEKVGPAREGEGA